MKKLVNRHNVLCGVSIVAAGIVLAACDIPSLPAGVWPKHFAVAPGHKPNVKHMLVTELQIASTSNANLSGDWEADAEPTGSPLPTYPVKNCAEATANYDQFGLPDAFETVVGCPTVADAKSLWAHINFHNMSRGGWQPAPGFGQYGNESKSYVQLFGSNDMEPCWAYVTLSRVNNIVVLDGLCDVQINGPTATAAEAQAWTAMAVARVQVTSKFTAEKPIFPATTSP